MYSPWYFPWWHPELLESLIIHTTSVIEWERKQAFFECLVVGQHDFGKFYPPLRLKEQDKTHQKQNNLWKLPSFRLRAKDFFFNITKKFEFSTLKQLNRPSFLCRAFSLLSLGNQQYCYHSCKKSTQFSLHLLLHDRGKPLIFSVFRKHECTPVYEMAAMCNKKKDKNL